MLNTIAKHEKKLAETVIGILNTPVSPKFKVIPSNGNTCLSIVRRDKVTMVPMIKVKLISQIVEGHELEELEPIGIQITADIYNSYVKGDEAVEAFKGALSRALQENGEDEFEYILNDFID